MAAQELDGLWQPLPGLDGAARDDGTVGAKVVDLLHRVHIDLHTVFGQCPADGFGHTGGGAGAAGICDQNAFIHTVCLPVMCVVVRLGVRR